MDWTKHVGRVVYRLGETVTVVGSSTAELTGVFLSAHQRLNLGLEAGINSASPRLIAMTADLPASPTAVITSRGTHNVKDIQPDDPGGFTTLELFET